MNSIYGIKNEQGKIYYIGRTKNLTQRKRQHKWLGRAGAFVVLATCEDDDAKELERYYISKYKQQLINKIERYYTGVSVQEIQANR